AADRSYGVQVARLAGLPQTVVDRARDVLERLESGAREGSGAAAALAQDLPLFSVHVPQPMSGPVKPSAAEARLQEIQPDALSPRDALDLIYELRALAGDG
ncbi:MAG: DNA mismatch repair protein MutS, partial [Pseudomonadota bacterium]